MKMLFSHTFWVFVAAIACGGMLLHISQKVQQAEQHLAHLEAQIAEEETTVRVLGAEWEYLNSPARLEMLSGQYLDLVPAEEGVAAVSADDLPPMEQIIPAYGHDAADFTPASYVREGASE